MGKKESQKKWYEKSKVALLQKREQQLLNIEGIHYKGFIVKDDGTVINRFGKKVGFKQKNGYMYVSIYGKKVLMHRFVYEAFNGEIPEGYEIDHKNTVRDDNRLENLRLVTSKGNKNNPITKERYKTSNKGKITEEFSKSRKKYNLPKDRKEYLREYNRQIYYKTHREEILERMKVYHKKSKNVKV